MARSYRYLHFDVFTDRLFGGNQLAVFPDAHGLSDETMQLIAKEMNFSETTFVVAAERPDTDVRMRIFTPGAELPMAGHPTIGSTFALARTGRIAPPRERFVFGLNVGPIPVTLTWQQHELTFAWMTQLLPTFGPPIDRVRAAAAMLGCAPEAIADTHLPMQMVSCGVPFLLVPMATRRDVDDAMLDHSAFVTLMHGLPDRPGGVFFFSTEDAADGAVAYSRLFAPGLGISEDPATGSATGPLGCYLVKHGVVAPDQASSMLNLQGVKMGRPSHLHMSIGVERGEIVSVRVGGTSVLASEGFLGVA